MMEDRVGAIEKTVERHERTIEMLRDRLEEIHEGVTKIAANLNGRSIPGDSQFCRTHMQAIDALRAEVRDIKAELDVVKSWIWRGLGALALLVFLLGFFGPSIRSLLHVTSSTPTWSRSVGGNP